MKLGMWGLEGEEGGESVNFGWSVSLPNLLW